MSSKTSNYMNTTKKSPEQTISEIQQELAKFGARQVMTSYDENGIVNGMSFSIQLNNQLIPYKMPCNHEGIWKRAQAGEAKYIKNEMQARRVAWRRILRWVQAQLSMVEDEMTGVKEVFLPYTVNQITGKTLYQHFEEGGFEKLLPETTGE